MVFTFTELLIIRLESITNTNNDTNYCRYLPSILVSIHLHTPIHIINYQVSIKSNLKFDSFNDWLVTYMNLTKCQNQHEQQ